MESSRRDTTTTRVYQLARELGVESRDVLECARSLDFDITSPLAGVDADDADQIRACIRRPLPATTRAYELARELGVESRDVLECARSLDFDITSPLAGIDADDADQIRVMIFRSSLSEVETRGEDAAPSTADSPTHEPSRIDTAAGSETTAAAAPDAAVEVSEPKMDAAPVGAHAGTSEEATAMPPAIGIDKGAWGHSDPAPAPPTRRSPHVDSGKPQPSVHPSSEATVRVDPEEVQKRRPVWARWAIGSRTRRAVSLREWHSPTGPREITWLLVLWAVLLPIHFALFSSQKRGLQIAPSDVILVLIVLIALPHIRFRRRTWSAWHFAIPIAIAASALFFGVLSRYAVVNKLSGILVLLALYAVLTSFAVTWQQIWLIMRGFLISVVIANAIVSTALIVGVDLPMRVCHSPSCIRLTGFYTDANIYGSLLIVALAFLLATMGTSARLVPRGVPTILSLVSLVIGLFLTLSRSSWIGLALVIVALTLLRPRQAARSVVIGGAILATLFVFVFGSRTADLLSTAGRTFSIESRFRIIDNALAAFRENPVLGIGIGTFPDRYDAIVHNTVLWLAAEMGMVGLILFFGFFFWIGWRLVWLYRNTTGSRQAIVLGLGLAHFAMLGFSIGVEAFYQRHWWLAMALIVAAYATEWETIDSLEATVDDPTHGDLSPDRRVPGHR